MRALHNKPHTEYPLSYNNQCRKCRFMGHSKNCNCSYMESEPENVKELSYLLYLCHNCSLYSHVFWDSLQGIIINCSHVSLLHLTMSSFKVVSTFYLYYILSAYYSSWKKWLLLLETNMSNFKYVIVCSWMISNTAGLSEHSYANIKSLWHIHILSCQQVHV